MNRRFSILFAIAFVALLVTGCSQEPEVPVSAALLQHVPADTPYVFVTSQHLPDELRAKLGDHYAEQLAIQRSALLRMREQIEATQEAEPIMAGAGRIFDVIDAVLAEFEGRTTAAEIRELGIEPVTRSVIYGLGLLPVIRVEIADADKLNSMLDRVEQRVGMSAARENLNGQDYRRFDLGEVDAVLSVTGSYAIAGLLPDALFERDLPMLLGQTHPATSLVNTGDIEALVERHGFSGYGEGFIKLDTLLEIAQGKAEGRNAEQMQVLSAEPMPIPAGCVGLSESLVAGMPRMVMGITEAADDVISVRGVWESNPGVAAYLQKLATPVPGVGGAYDGLLAFGMGMDLPQLRNAIDALIRQVIAAGAECEWVEPDKLQAVIPQLNLALGPMTAGIKGFNLRIDDLQLDPESLQPLEVRAGLLAAVDDPRGVFALGAMFNPALAALEVPNDGTLVELPQEIGLDPSFPSVQVAIKDKALLLVAGAEAEQVSQPLLNAAVVEPPPLIAVDYGIHSLVQRFGAVGERAIERMREQGQVEMAQELDDQLAAFRLQSKLFDRLSVSMHASDQGLVMDQVMRLR